MLWEISWPNLIMYSATIPTYEKKGKDEEKDEKVRHVDDDDEIAKLFGL